MLANGWTFSRSSRRPLAVLGLVLWLVLWGGSGLACSGVTPEERIELATEVASNSAQVSESALGWNVEVDEAWLSLGSLRWFAGEPLGSRSRWLDLFVKTAHAHPGHYLEGDVLAEMLTPAGVDLTRTTQLAHTAALSSEPHSAALTLVSPRGGPAAAFLGDAVVRVVGRAERTSEEPPRVVYFSAQASPSDLSADDGVVRITGCPFDGGRLRAGGTLRLDVDVALWFDQVDFTALPEGSPDAPSPLEDDARAHGGFLRGLQKAHAYQFRFLEDAP